MNLGAMRNLITVENPSDPVPDGLGGFTLNYVPADYPDWWAAIDRASVRASERLFAGTVISHASYILRGRFHAEIGMQTRLSWTDRAGAVHVTNVLDVTDPEGSGVETIVLCSEVAS